MEVGNIVDQMPTVEEERLSCTIILRHQPTLALFDLGSTFCMNLCIMLFIRV